jgi:hypothetical protein
MMVFLEGIILQAVNCGKQKKEFSQGYLNCVRGEHGDKIHSELFETVREPVQRTDPAVV